MDEEPKSPSRLLKWAGILAALAVIALGVGVIGHISGAGWFGHRTWLYGDGELYALNMGDDPLWVAVDGRERKKVPPNGAQIFDLVGGTSIVEVTDEGSDVVDRYDVTVDDSHAFLKLTDEGCLAIVDITPFYGGQQGKRLDFDAFLRQDARVWIAGSKNVVWPRKDFPSKLSGGEGPGLWFELVACELFEEQDFLDAYLATRIEQRMASALGKDGAPK